MDASDVTFCLLLATLLATTLAMHLRLRAADRRFNREVVAALKRTIVEYHCGPHVFWVRPTYWEDPPP